MLIAIEGCLGVGKSTIAKGLAAFRGSALLLEEFESNPFLRAFYEDPVGTATETEFSFLLLHFHQLKANAKKIAEREVISDFHLGKDLLYADLNLPNLRVRNAFGDLYGICDEGTSAPALLIFLSSTNDLLMDRIRARNRDYEQDIDVGYYASINAAYEEFFPRYVGEKIIISMNDWDFVKSPILYEKLSEMVDRELGISV
jgi:deoxyadenosine/deoxycytidine kinase